VSKFVSIDFETFYSRKLKCSVSGNLPEEYVQHELFDTYMLSYCDGERAWSGHPSEFNWNALDGKVLLSHNRRFDQTVYNRLVEQKLAPKINFAGWKCTANLTSYLCNRRSLDAAVEHLFKIKLDKSARANAEGKRWPNDFSEQERVNMLRYAKDDALWCWRLWNDFSAQMPSVEQRLSDLTIEQGMHGVQINVELLHEYLNRSHDMLMRTTKEIPWMQDDDSDDWDEFNASPTSTKCIVEQCRRKGIPAPPVKTRDAEAYQEWEDTYAPQHPWIFAVTAWRSINKLYKTLLLVKRRLNDDGIMPFSLKYFGAHTGRWSGDARINMQNMRKVPVFQNEHCLMETDDRRVFAAMEQFDDTGAYPTWVKGTIDFRALIIPRPGTKMIVSDLAQIEPRVLGWLTGNKELLEKISGGMSIYESFARTTMGYSGPKMDKASKEYKLIKIQVLQLGYQAGWKKFISTALKESGMDLTETDPETVEVTDQATGKVKTVPGYGTFARNLVDGFRKNNPKIVKLWEKMDDAFRRSIGGNMPVTLPNGRKMCYADIKGVLKIVKDPETGKPRRNWEYTATTDGHRRLPWYGGKIVENVTQAIARDVFGESVVRMDSNGWCNLFSSHDEAILEVDKSVTARDVEHEMSKTPEWLPGCPIGAEAKEVQHYLK